MKYFDQLEDLEQEAPPIAGEADVEHETRLEAERCTWEFRLALRPQASQQPIDELPLFGGRYQGELFE